MEQLSAGLSFDYPYAAATHIPSKQTATQRKGRQKDQEAAENAQSRQPVSRTWRSATFGKEQSDPFAYGNAVHRAMQYIQFSECGSKENIELELKRLQQEGYLSAEECSMINSKSLASFFETALGKKLRESKTVLREFKFSVLEDADIADPTLQGEKVLLQGVVDCAILEEDGITILDFKTDYVTEHTIQSTADKYRVQIETYGDALERIYEKPIKQKFLYFFQLNQFIPI
jgi:ATP-dependent helicase/nuclease subunit A